MPLPFLKPDDSHQFQPLLAEIEDDPGSPLGPLTFWLVLAVFLFFVLWAILGQIDVVVSARGKLVPFGQVKAVQPLETGVIRQILVKEGDFVRKGQPLVVIDPATTEPALESSRRNLSYIQQEQARLQASVTGGAFNGGGTQASMYRASMNALQKQLSAKRETLNNLAAQVSARQVERQHVAERLEMDEAQEARLRPVQDIIARQDYDRVMSDILAGRNKLQELAYEIEQLRFQQEQTRQEMAYLQENFKSRMLTDLSEREKQANQLQAMIQEGAFRNARQTLAAPVDGYVHEMTIHTVGGVVTPAEKLLSIVPANTPLVVEATVLNKDIGFVRKNMPVNIKIDTFDFQKYGTIPGKVSQVDPNSREDERLGPVYTVYVQPGEDFIKVEGKPHKLTAGLSLTAEIKVGQRRIIEFFIYPIVKHLDEGMSVR